MTSLDPYVVRQASLRASLLVSSTRFRSADRDDLIQEIVLDFIRRAPRFDPSRGDWHGFIRGVTRNYATVLVMRERRRAPELPTEDLLTRQDASTADFLDLIDARRSSGMADRIALRLDVRRVLESLPLKLQSLARLLGQFPVQDVCQLTGRSRSRVYQMTKQIRQAFIDCGSVPYSERRSGRRRRAKHGE